MSDHKLAETISKIRALCSAAKELTESPIPTVHSLALQVLAGSRLMLLEVSPEDFEPISTCEKFPVCSECEEFPECRVAIAGGQK